MGPEETYDAADGRATVAYSEGGAERSASARQLIVAVPPPSAAPLLPQVAPDAAGALDGVPTGPFISLGIRTNERDPMPWDDVHALSTPERSFNSMETAAGSGLAAAARAAAAALRGAGPRGQAA